MLMYVELQTAKLGCAVHTCDLPMTMAAEAVESWDFALKEPCSGP